MTGDYGEFAARLPASHRDALSKKVNRRDTQRKRQMAMIVGLVHEPHLRALGNMIQTAVALEMNVTRQIPWAEIKKHALMEGYVEVVEMLRCVRNDLSGDEHPYSTYLRQDGLGSNRRPSSERRGEAIRQCPGINPFRVSRCWIMAVNDDYEGGEIYFPTREVAYKLEPGNALVFWPELPYGIAPVTKGVRRLLVGWATKDYRIREKEE